MPIGASSAANTQNDGGERGRDLQGAEEQRRAAPAAAAGSGRGGPRAARRSANRPPSAPLNRRVRAGALVEDVVGEGGQPDREVEAEGADEADQHDRPDQVGAPGHIAQPLAQLALAARDAVDLVEFRGPHHQQPGERGDEGQPVEQERPAAAEGGDQHTGDGGPDQPGGLEVGGVEADGVAQLVRADHLGDEGLPGRVVEDGDQAEDEGDQVDVPDLHMAAQREHGEGEAGEAHRGLGDQQQRALGEAVGDDAAVEPEEQHRQELQRGGDADGGGGAGEAEHQPVLGDALHPGTGVGHHLAGGEEPVVTDSK